MEQLSVAELNGYVRAVLDSDPILADVWVQGEVSNCKRHTSGHWYLTLKEGSEAIDAVCFRSMAARLTTLPRDGMAVLAHGQVRLYGSRVQLYIDMLRPAGEGLLQAQFERLRAQLEAEGLFARQRALPLYPQRIGIVTSPTGAALRDMLNVLSRRYPLAEVVLSSALVQGDLAMDSLVEALYALYDQSVDVIIVGRGGGSIEDLWCFNEEVVARAIYASPVPIVTGVGHETDTTIADYVADLRAPTPSAAAELCTPDLMSLHDHVLGAYAALNSLMLGRLQAEQLALRTARERLARRAPLNTVLLSRQRVDYLLERAGQRLQAYLKTQHLHLRSQQRSLAALNPLATLARGYAVIATPEGAVITDPAQVQPGDPLTVRVRAGTFQAEVTSAEADRG